MHAAWWYISQENKMSEVFHGPARYGSSRLEGEGQVGLNVVLCFDPSQCWALVPEEQFPLPLLNSKMRAAS